MQSRDNIRFTCWLDVSLNAFPELLFDWTERARGKTPAVLPEVNKDIEHTAIMERQLRGLILSLVILYYIVCIYHFRQYTTFENEAQMRLEDNVLMHCKRRRRIASHQISMRLRSSSQPQVCPRPAMLNYKHLLIP